MKRYLVTLVLAIAAIGSAATYYFHYIQNPWTRDGQVRAHVVQVTPRVTGAITQLNIQDNAQVNKGDVLFIVDQKPYKVALLKAKAAKEQAEALLTKAQNELLRGVALEQRSPGAVPTLTLNNYETAVDTAKANLSVAEASVEDALLNLSYTEVKAPANGFVTNLRHHVGAQVVANNPVVALIDSDSFWIEGFFKETDISDVDVNKTAKVTLLSDQNRVLEGHVESVGYGISKADGSTGYSLLPTVNPNFQWIRLAQRIPVKVKLTVVPDDVQLRVGMTASVQINK